MIGIIVAPGSLDSRIRFEILVRTQELVKPSDTYLSTPPPVPGVHLVVQPVLLLLVNIVPLGGEHKGPRKLGISIEGTNAFHNVAKIQIEGLPADYDLFSDESGTIWKVFVDDLVKLYCILVREAQALANLWTSMRSST
jgi:hypothetical protein